MSAEFVRRDEFETLADQMTGYIDITVQKYVRESERRVRAEIQTVRNDMMTFYQEFQAFRERHDVEMAQVHTELAQMREVLMWIVQRLPQEPISPPPAQFLKHDGENV